jgi:hypothetical protein
MLSTAISLSLEEKVYPELPAAFKLQSLRHRAGRAGDHPVHMGVDERNFIRGEKSLDKKLAAEGFGVVPLHICRVG